MSHECGSPVITTNREYFQYDVTIFQIGTGYNFPANQKEMASETLNLKV